MITGFTTALDSVPNGQWKILITDDHSQALLDTVYKHFDILRRNVTCALPPFSLFLSCSGLIAAILAEAHNADVACLDTHSRRTVTFPPTTYGRRFHLSPHSDVPECRPDHYGFPGSENVQISSHLLHRRSVLVMNTRVTRVLMYDLKASMIIWRRS